jgi:molecular chaperone Hsp33
VRELLGEMAAAGVLMQSNIKFNGALVLQIFGDGPVKVAVAEVQPDLSLRATAKVMGEVPVSARLPDLVNVNGQGRCAITLDPKDKPARPAALPGRGAAVWRQARKAGQAVEVLEHYMLQSEQLDTRLVLAADDRWPRAC